MDKANTYKQVKRAAKFIAAFCIGFAAAGVLQNNPVFITAGCVGIAAGILLFGVTKHLERISGSLYNAAYTARMSTGRELYDYDPFAEFAEIDGTAGDEELAESSDGLVDCEDGMYDFD